jgi:CheY-like chemotaxis protein/DNA-binding XRE family transcriptional regulator
MSQEALAERAELHRTYITDVERGVRNLSLESISKLARALELSIGSLFSPPEAGKTGGEPGSKSLVELLLAEHDPKELELTLDAFKRAKFSNHIAIVHDGAAALDYLFCRRQYAERHPSSPPQVILLELQLPKVHGLEVLSRIRADQRMHNIHVVVLTNSRTDADLRAALRLGADAFIVKPVDFEKFSAVMPQLNFHWSLLNSS